MRNTYNKTHKGVFEIHSNERKQQLLTILKSTASTAPVTVKTLAMLLKVSERTVRYDLRSLEDELKQEGWSLCSKNKCGIWLESTEKQYNEDTITYVYTPKERRNKIVIALLTKQISSIDKMAEHLEVSRGTLLGDLKLVQNFLDKRGLCYDSKRGLGVWAKGDEMAIRDTLVHIFSSGTYDFRNFLEGSDKSNQVEQMFREYSHNLPVQGIANCFLEFVSEKELSGTDLSMNRMVIALVVQMKRIQEHNLLKDVKKMSFLSDEGVFLSEQATALAERLANFAELFNSEDEIQGILKELMHSRIYKAQPIQRGGSLSANEMALGLAREFIMDVQTWLGDNYLDDEELIYNLAMHLQPAIERAWCGIVFSNPLLLEIRTQYKEVFNICKNAADQITRKTGVSFSEDEIGYLTVHIGAAIERHKMRHNKKLSVLLVCGNGIGMANLLELTLQNHLSYIDVVKKISFYQLTENDLNGIDLVISTMDLNLQNKAVLRVSPILSDAEIKILENQIRYVYNKKYQMGLQRLVVEQRQQRLCDLLQEDVIELGCSVENWEDAVRLSGKLLENIGSVEAKYVDGMVNCIRNLGTYIVVCPGVAMPHARPEEGAKDVAISFVQLKKPVYFGKEGNNVPVDLLFAFSTPDEQTHLKMMMDLWTLFYDEKALNKLRKCKTKESVISIIRKCINRDEK